MKKILLSLVLGMPFSIASQSAFSSEFRVAIAISEDLKIAAGASNVNNDSAAIAAEKVCRGDGGKYCRIFVETTGPDQCIATCSDGANWVGTARWSGAPDSKTSRAAVVQLAVKYCKEGSPNPDNCTLIESACNYYYGK